MPIKLIHHAPKLSLTLWLAMLFVLSVVKVPDMGIPSKLPVDKLVHAVLYGIASLLFLNVLTRKAGTTKNSVLCSIVLSSAYGLLIEAVQLLFPHRGFSLGDIVANTLGAILFTGAYYVKSGAREGGVPPA